MMKLKEFSIFLNYKEIIFYKDIISNSPSFIEKHEEYQKFLHNQLYQRPYPALQIIEEASKNSEPIQDIIYETLKKYLEEFTFETDEQINKFLNFLTNFKLPDDYMYENLLPKMCKYGNKFPVKMYFSLTARNNSRIMKCYLETEQKYLPLFSKQSILWKTINEKRHIITAALQNYYPFDEVPKFARNTIILLKLIHKLNIKNNTLEDFPSFSKILSCISENEITHSQRIFYFDLCRINNILEFFEKHSKQNIEIDVLLEANHVLEIICRYSNISVIGYDEIKAVIERNNEYLMNMEALDENITEIEYLSYCFILLTVFDIIVMNSRNPNYEMEIDNKLSSINVLFRKIKNIEDLSSLIENIFKILLLRWEHLNFSQRIEAGKYISSETDLDTNVSSNDVSVERHGFICRSKALKAILEFLKKLMAKRHHSEDLKNADERSRSRFSSNFEKINNALWKLSLFNKWNGERNDYTISPDELIHIVQVHLDCNEKSSSDDESIERRHASFSRRKMRAKKRLNINTSKSQNPSENNNNNGDEQKNQKNWSNPRGGDQNIIGKMLSTPEDLLLAAIAAEDFTEAKKIIQTFNIGDTDLAKELTFLENMKQVKAKLYVIYEKYQEQIAQSINVTTTIEQIKSVAAIGFESLKITNMVEKFAQSNQIQVSPELQNLIEKHSINYPYLRQYMNSSVNAINIFDLVLNSPFNSDISCNILNMTERLYGISFQDLKNFKEIGCFCFLKNLIECLRLYKSISHENISIKKILTETSYSLRPSILSNELEREKIFQKLFSKNEHVIENLNDLKSLSKEFEALKPKINYFSRFLSYITNLFKLLQLKDNSRNFTISEALQFDPIAVVGELIFEYNMTPLEIENIVTSLNLNFVHVIALNICPDLCKAITANGYRRNSISQMLESKNQSIYNYITHHNVILGYLLQQIKGFECDVKPMNTKYFERAMELNETHLISHLYNKNLSVAALAVDRLDFEKLSRYRSDNRIVIEICKILSEGSKSSTVLDDIQNNAVISSILDSDRNFDLLESINDVSLRSHLLLENLTRIKDATLAKHLVKCTILHKHFNKLPDNVKNQLNDALTQIKIYSEISNVLSTNSWTKIHDYSTKCPDWIMKKLLLSRKYELCYEWSIVCRLTENFPNKHKLLLSLLLDSLIETRENVNIYLLKLVEGFPAEDVNNFYADSIHKLRSITLLNYIIEYLIKNTKSLVYAYQNYRISLRIFQCLTFSEQEQNWILLSKPLLLLEYLIMNSKFESLSKAIEAIKPYLENDVCKFCSDKYGQSYDIYCKSGKERATTSTYLPYIPMNLSFYQKDHIITVECLDLLLRIYATKALDYQINEVITSSSERVSQSTDLASLDSLCGVFVMPKNAPTKDNWIKDEDAVHCMCCRRTLFTMLMRRHHCRRCGRVVCFACSTNRMKIPELYDEVQVRVCNDCVKQTETLAAKAVQKPSAEMKEQQANILTESKLKSADSQWQLSGKLSHDQLLREEFCYEHAPSVALCLTILSFHSSDQEYIQLLLYHCRKLEKLLRPNPEVDYALVAKMINCLALAAKVRGGPPEVDSFRDHSEIILSVVQNGYEYLLPTEPINNQSLRKLADALILAEKWELALNIFLKCGFPKSGVMVAHGLACLRAGCFQTAREKFSYCMPKLCTEADILSVLKVIIDDTESTTNQNVDILTIKRPNRSPPLLEEIVNIIEFSSNVPQPETLVRANVIRNSNTSLASNRSKWKENIPIHEPAINILNTLSNLKQITRGNYCDKSIMALDNNVFVLKTSRTFEECLHYLMAYGSHTDIINFLIRHKQLTSALKYFIIQNVSNEVFVQNIYIKYLKTGNVEKLISHMLEMDDRLLMWKDTIIYTCRYLEIKNLLNSLYQLQILLKDPVRASMTCVKFYSMNCTTFQELYNNRLHLKNAQMHLEQELEICQWENINIERKRNPTESSFLMLMDAKSLSARINTIRNQMEVTTFLANCERKENSPKRTKQILKEIRLEVSGIPTLFDSMSERIQICILILLCGKNVEEGFHLTNRLIKEYKLPTLKIYGPTAKYLSRNGRLAEVEKLINCIMATSEKQKNNCDEILSVIVQSAVNNHEPEVKTILDNLIKKITDLEVKISCYIYVGQLKSAYLLAIQYNRLNDIRRILRQAEILNQTHIKKLCEKKLNMNK